MSHNLISTLGALLLILFAMARVGAGVYPSYSLDAGDQDVRIHTNMHGSLKGRQASFGDFNKDGRLDAAFMHVLDEMDGNPLGYPVTSQISILQGVAVRWPKTLNLIEHRATYFYEHSVFYPGSENNYFALLEGVGDWNNDGEIDFVMFDSRLSVFWGNPDGLKPVDKDHGDVAFYWPSNAGPRDLFLTSGDVNGDEVIDFIVADSSRSPGIDSVDIFLGGPSWSGFTYVEGTRGVLRWRGYADCLKGINPVFRWNWDIYDDVVLSRSGGIEVMFGSEDPPANWDASVSQAPLKLTASPGWTLAFGLFTDLTGDGQGDVVVEETSGDLVRWRMLDGSVIHSLSGTMFVEDLSPFLLRVGEAADHLEAAGDFDGDGRSDLVWSSTAPARTVTSIFLAADQPATGDWSNGASFTIEGDPGEKDEYHMNDMDGDGKDDLWMIQKPTGGLYRWHINLFYGFRPLKNPVIQIVGRDAGSKRRTLDLAVEGHPVEMKLSGHIEDDIKDRWIPYERQRRVSLTSTPGTKIVMVVFRNSSGRESSPVSVSETVASEGPRIKTVTNRIAGSAGEVEVDCRVMGGRLKVMVYERGGRRVRTVADVETSGVKTVRWDGGNDAGERVRPGVYVMTLDFDGHVDRCEILVEP